MEIDSTETEQLESCDSPEMIDEPVTISRREFDALRVRAGRGGNQPTTESTVVEEKASPEASRSAEVQADRVPASPDRRLAELERTCKAAVRDRELATALAGKPLVAGAAAQLIKLWRDDFDAYEEHGEFKAAARDGRTINQVVNAWLASPEYAHFCLPTSRGGTGDRDGSRPASAGSTPNAPRNLGESVIHRWREESAARPANLLKPVGLRRYR